MESTADTRDRAKKVIKKLKLTYPDAKCSLNFSTPFQLLVATILSARCTDEKVNQVTAEMFHKYGDPQSVEQAPLHVLEQSIHAIGLFRMKARAIQESAQDIMLKHGGEIPHTLEELTELRGVGRKTANVILGVAFGQPAIVVDTHVHRLSVRLGFTTLAAPHQVPKVEQRLVEIIAKKDWTIMGHLFIYHGRAICTARSPKCDICPILRWCPHGQSR